MTNRLLSYGSLTLGTTTLLSGNADAATVVDVNSNSYNTGFVSLGTATVSVTQPFGSEYKGQLALGGNLVGTAQEAFQRGSSGVSFTPDSSTDYTPLQYGGNFGGGATTNGAVAGSDNWLYAVSSANPAERVWLQLDFGPATSTPGTGTIIKAVFPSFEGELPTAILASSAVPEPSALALLSLGASGLVLRRRRRTA